MKSWFDKAVREIEKDHEDGLMTDNEYTRAMSELYKEYRDYAQEETDRYFDSLMIQGY